MKALDKFMYTALGVFVAFTIGFVIYMTVAGTVGWS